MIFKKTEKQENIREITGGSGNFTRMGAVLNKIKGLARPEQASAAPDMSVLETIRFDLQIS